MNIYGKWGLKYLNSLMRHIAACGTLWTVYEMKYQEVNWADLGWAMLVGAVFPTLKEMFTEGLPNPEATVTTTTTAAVSVTTETEKGGQR